MRLSTALVEEEITRPVAHPRITLHGGGKDPMLGPTRPPSRVQLTRPQSPTPPDGARVRGRPRRCGGREEESQPHDGSHGLLNLEILFDLKGELRCRPDCRNSSSSMYATHRTEHSAHRLHTVLLCIVRGGNQRGGGEIRSGKGGGVSLLTRGW